jgi:hypothetical protein
VRPEVDPGVADRDAVVGDIHGRLPASLSTRNP